MCVTEFSDPSRALRETVLGNSGDDSVDRQRKEDGVQTCGRINELLLPQQWFYMWDLSITDQWLTMIQLDTFIIYYVAFEVARWKQKGLEACGELQYNKGRVVLNAGQQWTWPNKWNWSGFGTGPNFIGIQGTRNSPSIRRKFVILSPVMGGGFCPLGLFCQGCRQWPTITVNFETIPPLQKTGVV